MEGKLKFNFLKRFMKFPCFSGFRLKYKIFFYEMLDLFSCHFLANLRTYFDESSEKSNPVWHKFGKDELNLWI